MEGLKSSEIHWVVNNYIGVSGGYLGDFSYASHREFYADYCDLEIDVDAFAENTTRKKFIAILSASEPRTQAAILIGLARRFPVGSEMQRNATAYQKLLALAKRCQQVAVVDGEEPRVTSDIVQRALAEATTLLKTHGPTSAVDRLHTALHGYLRTACRTANLDLSDAPSDPRIVYYFKVLRQRHPGFEAPMAQQAAMKNILNSAATLLEQLDPIRNRATLAHANEELISHDEALLVINLVRSLMQYFDAKLRS
ncbi:abortive infection family protein [Pseudoxanthomonas beigongshangi]|uniref:abortive infection family protein n=1 Tax=Pseudoxanthomonas beigongshangi TaxID=2782537 RepID=UPI00193B2EAD|nr:abortive infection family protein [Pseudoxanthomonas beigongshangi]UBB24830.1 abortive infection family protein [Pseudoxanthomonas japonensis]